MVRSFLRISCIFSLLILCGTIKAYGETVDFKFVQEQAKSLAKEHYQPPEKKKLPEVITNLTSEQYKNISRDNMALWQAEKLPFQIKFDPLGYKYDIPVSLNEFKGAYAQNIRYNPNFFSLNSVKQVADAMPSDAGYAGFRILSKQIRSGKFDNLISFLGGSKIKAVGGGSTFGVAARGLAIKLKSEKFRESFPRFIEFWLGKPDSKAKNVVIYGLLNGDGVTGAYEFTIIPGESTTVKVRSTLYFRKQVVQIGLSPMTSFFWFGDNTQKRFDDYRPEVHNSDGMIISEGKDTHIWQPLVNYFGKSPMITNFHSTRPNYFGLIQRDRSYEDYLDSKHLYNKKSNLWITPGKNWGTGTIRLVEFPTDNENDDNIALFWIPDITPTIGKAFNFNYTMHWSIKSPPLPADIATVKFTRYGINHNDRKQTFFVVNFTGSQLKKLASVEPVSAVVKVSRNGKLVGSPKVVKVNFDDSWGVKFTVEVGNGPQKKPVDLSCILVYKDKKISETWNYKWWPSKIPFRAISGFYNAKTQ